MASNFLVGLGGLASGLAQGITTAKQLRRQKALDDAAAKQREADNAFRDSVQRRLEAQNAAALKLQGDQFAAVEANRQRDDQRADRTETNNDFRAPMAQMLNSHPEVADALGPVMSRGEDFYSVPKGSAAEGMTSSPEGVVVADPSSFAPNLVTQGSLLAERQDAMSAAAKRIAERQAQQDALAARYKGAQIDSAEARANTAGHGARLPRQTIDQITGYDNIIESANKIVRDTDALSQKYSGRLSKYGNKVANFLNVDDPEVSAYRAFIGQNLADYVFSVSGKAVTDAERRFLASIQPGENDQPETVKAKARQFADWMKQKRRRELQNYGRANYDTSGFDTEYQDEKLSAATAGAARPRRTDPNTGETREWDGKQWVPVKGA